MGAGLGDYESEILDLSKKINDLQARYTTAQAQIAYYGGLNDRHGVDVWNNISASVSSELNAAQQNLLDLQAKQQGAATKTAQVETAKALSPAAQAEAARKGLTDYVSQVNILRSGGFYDYGAGSSRRNKFFGQEARGLSALDGWSDNTCGQGKLVLTLALFVASLAILRR
jgi:hypothetical protein